MTGKVAFKSKVLKKASEEAEQIRQALKNDETNLLKDYKAVFGTDQGMRVLAHIISLVPIFHRSRDVRDAGGADAVNEICHYVGLADPFIYPEMLRRRAEIIDKLRQEEK